MKPIRKTFVLLAIALAGVTTAARAQDSISSWNDTAPKVTFAQSSRPPSTGNVATAKRKSEIIIE